MGWSRSTSSRDRRRCEICVKSGHGGTMKSALAALLVLFACAHSPAAGPLELVESEPIETSLDRPDLRDAWQVWPQMIASARAHLEIAEFYASNEPGSRLEPVVQALLD